MLASLTRTEWKTMVLLDTQITHCMAVVLGIWTNEMLGFGVLFVCDFMDLYSKNWLIVMNPGLYGSSPLHKRRSEISTKLIGLSG